MFSERQGRTFLRQVVCELPLQVQRPVLGPNGEAVVTLLNPTGDLLENDCLDLSVVCEARTHVVLRQASATRLHACSPPNHIRATVDLRVAAEASLSYLPWELIPFADTHYKQQVHLHLESGARAVIWEILAPGRVWEHGASRQLALKTSISSEDRLTFIDQIRVSSLDSFALGGHRHVGTLLLLGNLYGQPEADRLHQEITEAGLVGSAALLPSGGVGARVVGRSADEIQRVFRTLFPDGQFV